MRVIDPSLTAERTEGPSTSSGDFGSKPIAIRYNGGADKSEKGGSTVVRASPGMIEHRGGRPLRKR